MGECQYTALNILKGLVMARHHMINGEAVPFTSAEETARDAEEVAWVAEFRANKTLDAKEEARRRILEVVPEWKQSNFNARMNELNKKVAIDSGTLTQAEQNEITAMEAVWGQAKAIRTKSDTLEVSIASMNMTQLQALNVTDNSHWS